MINKYLKSMNFKSTIWVYENFYFNFPADKIITKKKDRFLSREFKKLLALRYIFENDTIFFNYGAGLYPPYFTLDYSNYPIWKRPLVFIYCFYIDLMSKVEIFLIKI